MVTPGITCPYRASVGSHRNATSSTVTYGGTVSYGGPCIRTPILTFIDTKTFVSFNPLLRLTYRFFLRDYNLILHLMELKSNIRFNKISDF
ncbi:hypothetical protein Hanom_Chr15g01338401 [Helianthus anomalus]